MAKSPSKTINKYDEKLSIKGSFDDVIKASVFAGKSKKPASKESTQEKLLKEGKKYVTKVKAAAKKKDEKV